MVFITVENCVREIVRMRTVCGVTFVFLVGVDLYNGLALRLESLSTYQNNKVQVYCTKRSEVKMIKIEINVVLKYDRFRYQGSLEEQDGGFLLSIANRITWAWWSDIQP